MAVIFRQTEVVTNAANSAVILPRPQNPLQIGFGVEVLTGAPSLTVQFCFDEAFAVWYDHPDVTAVLVNTAGNIDKPITGLRLHNTVAASTAQITVNQYVG